MCCEMLKKIIEQIMTAYWKIQCVFTSFVPWTGSISALAVSIGLTVCAHFKSVDLNWRLFSTYGTKHYNIHTTKDAVGEWDMQEVYK